MEAHHKGQGRKVTWCVWQVLADKSRTKCLTKTKIGSKIVHSTSNNAPQIQGQSSKVKVTRPTNAHTVNIQYLPNGKAYELQTWYTGAARRPASAIQAPWLSTSKVKVARSGDASDRCWPISRERNVVGRPKLVERLHTSRAIMCSSFKPKDEESTVTRLATAETKTVLYLLNGKTYELQNWYPSGACAFSCHAQL